MADRSARSSPEDPRQRLGRWGEKLATIHLQSKGYRIRHQNWRTRSGEIDLVAQDGEEIVFVEVKTRRGDSFGVPEEAITPQKAERLLTLGKQYIAANELFDAGWRVDLVAIELDADGRLLRCEHIPHVVLGW